MDLNGQSDDLDLSISSMASSSRQHQPDDSDQSNDQKRAKARERQRRKRERDRAGMGVMSFSEQSPPAGRGNDGDASLTPEELAKKDRIRAAARERQRKHRAVVKAKRMAEMGMQMAMESAAGVAYHEGYHLHHMQEGDPHNPIPEPPFPMPQPNHTPGQTFASILLLSFSCTPLLKQHLLRTLNMTNEELASFEPIIAGAWDHWNQERTMQYTRQAEQHGQVDPSSPYSHQNAGLPSQHSPYPSDAQQLHGDSSTDFRSRFQRPLGANSPFAQPGTHHHPIDPSLNNGADMLGVSDVRGNDDDDDATIATAPEIDPDLGDGGT